MALNIPSSFSIFSPKSPSCPRHSTEVRFSRWNNANAQKFIIRERTQREIEDEIRHVRRFESATRIVENFDPGTDEAPPLPEFKSVGTPSTPSRPSIPGKKSKYSKPPRDDENGYSRNPRTNKTKFSHPAFRPINLVSRVPQEAESGIREHTDDKPKGADSGIREHADDNPNSTHPAFRGANGVSSVTPENANCGVAVGEHGVSYRVPHAPFEFQYSYTETPKVKPLALREPPFLPFGPSTMPRPWTGRAPHPPSKKKRPEFDSFRLPPPGKKGVKPVQAPGPFLAGSGPKYVKSMEEILGEPLTEEEVKDLIKKTLKTKRQLNMGRDGLTHNMLDNIHAHWKRKRVCKIKCKGVCTVDIDNVHQQLEEKTGGKIIYSRGGVIYLFRGRNYNYRTRPRYPLMLWRPVTPVYPRLVQRVPEGLTLEEATAMRKRGRELPPICKLGRNGLYSNLVMNVREAFEECELVRIDCQGLDKSDFKKIGAKLRDLVPCVLISFEREHILMWRGKGWKSSLPILETEYKQADESTTEGTNVPLPENEYNQAAASMTKSPNILVPENEYNQAAASMTKSPNILVPENECNLAAESIAEDKSVPVPENEFNQAANYTTKGTALLRMPENKLDPAEEYASEGVSINSNSASDCLLVENKETSDLGTGKSPYLDAFHATPNPNAFSGLDLETGNQPLATINGFSHTSYGVTIGEQAATSERPENDIGNDGMVTDDKVASVSENTQGPEEPPRLQETSQSAEDVRSSKSCTEGVLLLRQQAVESGLALGLDDDALDANIIFERAVTLAETAPPGPTFVTRIRKVVRRRNKEKQEDEVSEVEVEGLEVFSGKKESEETSPAKHRRKEIKDPLPDVVPHGSLRVDELAKLLG